MKKKVKALGMFSGGLDSVLAAQVLKEQGIEVELVTFISIFNEGGKDRVKQVAEEVGLPINFVELGKDYLKVILSPKHGYGSGVNPCIDCRIFLLKKAKEFAKKIGADFIFTGEVLGQRPMSQHKQALMQVEEEAGVKGFLLRPLSARVLPETEIEAKGLVDREKLLAIHGRSRKEQLALAKKFGFKSFTSPAGGCLLTEKEYAAKFNDLVKHEKGIDLNDLLMLKYGRHFRSGKNKFVVGRNHEENLKLMQLKKEDDFLFEVKVEPGPTTVLQGEKTKQAIETAAALTARYSDAKEQEQVNVNYGLKKLDKEIVVAPLPEKELEKLRIKAN